MHFAKFTAKLACFAVSLVCSIHGSKYIKNIFFNCLIAYVIDNEDGTFTVSYQPIVRGAHQIKISMRNININGSPFTVNVTGRMDFAKVGKVLACFGCEGSGGGKT